MTTGLVSGLEDWGGKNLARIEQVLRIENPPVVTP